MFCGDGPPSPMHISYSPKPPLSTRAEYFTLFVDMRFPFL
jgi:hypothetical protein